MSLNFHEITHAEHRILDPLTDAKLMLLGEVSRVGPDTRILDLACGKGEMLCRWAATYGSSGHGVDLSEAFLAAARDRAGQLGVTDRVTFEQGDAGAYAAQPASYDIASCLGATGIGGGLAGTIRLLRPAVRPDGLLLIGEPYWTEPVPDAAYEALGIGRDEFASLAGTLDRLQTADVQLVEMVLADGDSWDRYVAAQWWTTERWLAANPDHPDAPALREIFESWRRKHLAYQRRYLGWGVFVCRVPASHAD
jgi:SAM-dependent methyltransferase